MRLLLPVTRLAATATFCAAFFFGSNHLCNAQSRTEFDHDSTVTLDVSAIPTTGTFWSLQLTNWPPSPYDEFPAFPLYVSDTKSNQYYIDDLGFDYSVYWARLAAERRSRNQKAHKDDLPTLPGGGDYPDYGTNQPGIAFTLPDYVITTNYSFYTNFWLAISNSPTQAFVSIVSSLPGLTYQILTNSDLTTANWGLWQTLLASNSITPAPPINLNSNLFFEGQLVWSTGTNGLPDWWEMEYFAMLGIDPNGNPAGDGINNRDKYVLGLNPNVAYVSPLLITPPGGSYVYARLWIPGLSNLMQVLPSSYGINLQWRNGTGAGIRIFGAADSDGGTNYLFDRTTASNQVNEGWYPCFGYVTSNQPLAVSATAWNSLNGYPPSDHFIFCGTASGNDELVLQVTNAYGEVVGESSIFLNLKDIKQMYERWSVGEDPTQPPNDISTNCGDQGVASAPYPYDAAVDSAKPYILHVHGSNMKTWEKDRYAETMFKRLYWQGYQGRFGSFRWPTASGYNPFLLNAANFFAGIEYSAWQSAAGLENLLTRLNILYPGQVQLSAHSMGNIAAGEALRQATTTLVQTYTAFHGSVPAHTYDTNAPTLSLGSADVGESNVYAHYWTATNAQYFSGVVGAASYVNFFNTNDFVLNHWWDYQPNKPVAALGYGYIACQYYQGIGSAPTIMIFPTNTYQIFSFFQQAKCNCIGEQAGLGGVFSGNQVDLFAAPYSFGIAHKGHSAEFRSDNMSRAVFWNQVLVQMNLKR